MQTRIHLALGSLLCLIQPMVLADEPDDHQETLRLEIVIKHLRTLTDSRAREATLRGIVSALDGRRRVKEPASWAAVRDSLTGDTSQEVRQFSRKLSQLFGDEQAKAQAMQLAADPNAELAKRQTALSDVVSLRAEGIQELLSQLIREPQMRLAAIRSMAEIENLGALKNLVSEFEQLSDIERRATIETLAARRAYFGYLIQCLTSGSIQREQLPAHTARNLALVWGEKFESVFGKVPELAGDRVKKIEEFKKLLLSDRAAAGDAANGRKVFDQTCGACHQMYGSGGRVGPDLTGSNRANLDYILLNSVDPSYDVAEAYRMVIVQTEDGRIVNGVLDQEDGRRIILRTAEKPRVVIDKSEIEARRTAKKSIMPEGQLDQLKPQQVIDLITYLKTTQQVELP